MVDVEEILKFVDAVVDQFRPQRILLFGSYAEGDYNSALLLQLTHKLF